MLLMGLHPSVPYCAYQHLFPDISEWVSHETRDMKLKTHVNLCPWVCRPPGQCDLLVFAAPAGGLHLRELRQQLPVTSVSSVCHWGFLCLLPVSDVEPRRAAALCAAEPGAPETGVADQQQPAVPDPAQLRTAEIRGLCWWVHRPHINTNKHMKTGIE